MALKNCINCDINCPFKSRPECPGKNEDCILWQTYKIVYEGNALTLMAMKAMLEQGSKEEALRRITAFLKEHAM